jgi:anhydro-N-acetylmuramic acid kinase
VVESLIGEAGIDARDVDVVGFHGHIILHEPWLGRTIQIGDGARLAGRIGIDVVNEFRIDDVAAGGQGAPLVPLFHAAMSRDVGWPVAVLNIGGVANVTWIGQAFDPLDPAGTADEILAFDCGPGNALLDDWVFRHTGRHWDQDGALAAAGTPDRDVVDRFLMAPYFDRPPPKSLDRNDFRLDDVADFAPADGAATLAQFTARAVAVAARWFPAPVTRWLVCGGGRRNPVLMGELADALGMRVEPVEAIGWDGDALEAQAFAWLAVRSLAGLPLTLPTTTGVSAAMTGGRLHRYAEPA